MSRTFRCLTKTRVLVVFSILGTLARIQPAQGQAPREFDLLVGEWKGKGKLFGVDASFSMTWSWMFNRKFLRLSFQNSFPRGDDQEQVLKARGFYRYEEGGAVEGTWLDSRGALLPLRGAVGEGRLSITWGTQKTELGRTEYMILDKDRLHVVDFVFQDGEWEQFGSAYYTRVGAEADALPEVVPE